MQRSLRVPKVTLAYLVIAGLVALLLYPALAWLTRSWQVNPYYSHGFLIPAIALFLAWRQWRHVVARPRQGGSWIGLGVTLGSLAVIVWALRWQNYVVASLALAPLLAGLLHYLEGWPRLAPWLFPLLLLALMVPLPFVDQLSPWFQSFTARWATGLARLVGISAVQQGGEILLPGTTLVVGAPCSGLRSLVAMLTIGVIWIYLVEGRLLAKLLMLAAVVPLVALGNVLRIGTLLAVAEVFGEQVALTYYHDWSGIILFVFALGLLLALGKVLGCSRLGDDIF
jgi:exosortase